MSTVVNGLEDITALAGADLGRTGWMEMTQDRVNKFADATGDHQWIHVDTAKAAAGPFGGTIAHGYLTLSMVIPLFAGLLEVTGVSMGINYGLNKGPLPGAGPGRREDQAGRGHRRGGTRRRWPGCAADRRRHRRGGRGREARLRGPGDLPVLRLSRLAAPGRGGTPVRG
jgi:MaoC like domain